MQAAYGNEAHGPRKAGRAAGTTVR
jgi:hypothetical protein